MQKPVIGIRPAIDGRRKGIREGLEEQTIQMAHSAAALIGKLRYPDGTPVEVILAPSTIGGVKESADCAELFERSGVQITLTVSPCWCYGTETMDMDPHTIKAVWGFNGTERPGAVYLAAVLSAHAQKGLPAFGIYGHDVCDHDQTEIPADVSEKLLRFARAAVAAKWPRGKSYLQIGSMCMGIAGSILNQDLMQEYFGMRSESVDESELLRRIDFGIYDKEEFDRAIKWVHANCHEGYDKNPDDMRYSREEKDAQWEFTVKCMLIARDLMHGNPRLAELGYIEESCGHNAVVAGIQGQRQWTDYKPNFDFLEAMLNSQFDWNGLRESTVTATENDTLNGMSQLLLHMVSGLPGVFADVRTYWSPESIERVTGWKPDGDAKNGFIHLINSGAAALEGSGAISDDNGKPTMKPFWKMSDKDVSDTLEAVDWCPADLFYFRGGGFSSHYKKGTRGGMPATMIRINYIKNLGPTIQIAEGYTCELPEKVHKILDNRTDPTWPTTWFAPTVTGEGAFKDVYTVMQKWGANHGAFCAGHVGADLITLASMLRIPVSMHNVPADDVFRPHCWDAFGADDPIGADYRACAAYGPLYK